MVRELKQGYNKFPPASRRLAQILFPTDVASGLLVACCIWVAACAGDGCRWQQWSSAVAAAYRRTLKSLQRLRVGGGCKKRFQQESNWLTMKMTYTCLLMNESSWAWIGTQMAGWLELCSTAGASPAATARNTTQQNAPPLLILALTALPSLVLRHPYSMAATAWGSSQREVTPDQSSHTLLMKLSICELPFKPKMFFGPR